MEKKAIVGHEITVLQRWIGLLVSSICVISVLLWDIWYKQVEFSFKMMRKRGYQSFALIRSGYNMEPRKLPSQLAKLGMNFRGIAHLIPTYFFVTDADVANEVFVTKDPSFANRKADDQYLVELVQGTRGVIRSNYHETLVSMRKAGFKALHRPGSGLDILERLLEGEIGNLSDVLLEKEGTDIDPRSIIYGAIVSILTTMLFGENFSYGSEEVRLLHDYDQRGTRLMTFFEAPEVNYFPWLLNLPFPRYKKKKQEVNDFLKVKEAVMEKLLKKYKALYNPDDIHCVMSSLLKTQELQGSDVFTDAMVNNIVTDLIIAGSLTSSNSLSGLIYILAQKPEIQEKMFREIKEVVGEGRMPRAEDKDSLPYVQAVVLEALRYQSVLPLNPRVAAVDTELGGYFIPKNSYVFVNHWAIHHNPDKWERPDDFFPEHFLDKQGQLLPIDEYKSRGYFPFGAGRRNCIGEVFAKRRLFLMTAALVQRFQILPPTSGKLPEFGPEAFIYSMVTEPPEYEVQFVRR